MHSVSCKKRAILYSTVTQAFLCISGNRSSSRYLKVVWRLLADTVQRAVQNGHDMLACLK